MKRVAAIAVLGLLCLLEACGGGGGTTPVTGTGGPLKIVFAAASPDHGGSPLRVTLTANISGGTAPYYYAWDYSSDGAYDDYFNNLFQTTLSAQHDYYLTSTDGVTSTVYHALLRVTDSLGASVTSQPVTVTVNPGSDLLINDVTLFSDTQGPTGQYILSSGKPVHFQPVISGGVQPYTYQWDFDSNGSVDSTIANPQYTYTYTDVGAKTFKAHLRVVDAAGNAADHDVLAIIEGSGNPAGGGGTGAPGFTIVLNSSPPADANGVITLNWDASANTPGLPVEPQLDLSVVVDASQGGKPPFEYYWDFDNDGSIDSQAVSPTIPYYDTNRKILVNPYLNKERSKAYTLRVLVIDSFGQIQAATRTIVSNDVENSAGTLNVTPTYGVASSATAFRDTPPQQFNQVSGPLSETDVLFQVNATGGTGHYDWQVDIDGDGVADWPDIASDPSGFHALTSGADGKSGSDSTLVKFGFHDDGAGGKISEWPALGYYAVNAVVRSLDTTTSPPSVKQTFKVQMPVSLVRRDQIQITSGSLKARREIMIGGVSAPIAPNANGNYIPSQTVVVAGGYSGTTPLRDVQSITRSFTPPTGPNTLEAATTVVETDKLPMNQARAAGASCTDGTTLFVVGGENLDNGILGLSEDQPLLTNAGWAVGGNINAPDYYPLTRAAGTFMPVAVNGIGPGFFFAGGLHPPGGDVDNVSGRLIFSDLSDSDGNAANGTQLTFSTQGGNMVTERYDSCMAFANKHLYVIGGRVADGRSVTTVEAYNLFNGQWENVPPMHDFRSGASCETIQDATGSDVIYVIGGANYPSNGGDKTVVTTAEAFNTKTGVWSYTLGLPANSTTDGGATVALPGAGSATTVPAAVNTLWYVGGALAGGAETNNIFEFSYFYTITPTP